MSNKIINNTGLICYTVVPKRTQQYATDCQAILYAQFEGTVKGVLSVVEFAMACKDMGFYLRASDFLLILQRFGTDEGTNINVTELFNFIEQEEGGCLPFI